MPHLELAMNLYQQIIDAGEKATRRPWNYRPPKSNDSLDALLGEDMTAQDELDAQYQVLAANHADQMAAKLMQYGDTFGPLLRLVEDGYQFRLMSDSDGDIENIDIRIVKQKKDVTP